MFCSIIWIINHYWEQNFYNPCKNNKVKSIFFKAKVNTEEDIVPKVDLLLYGRD